MQHYRSRSRSIRPGVHFRRHRHGHRRDRPRGRRCGAERRRRAGGRRPLCGRGARGLQRLAGVGDRARRGDRCVPRRSDRRDLGSRQAGVAGGTRRLRPHRGVSLLRRSDRQRDRRARRPDQRVAARRGVHRLRRGRRRRGGRQRPGHLSDDRRRAAHLAQRGRWRGEHLHRLARHRVPAVGPGPVNRRARARDRSPTTRPPTTPTGGPRTSP